MSINRYSSVIALCFVALVSAPAQAATINVTGVGDLVNPAFADTSPNTSTGPGAVPPLQPSAPDNGTRGVCTLREAILSANGDIATTPGECVSATGTILRSYCPFYPAAGGAIVRTGECELGDAGADTIVFAPATRGQIQLDYTLPAITDAVRIVGLGPDQTILTGFAPYLAFLNPPAPTGSAAAADLTVDIPIFQVSPDLPSGAQVSIESLQVLGARVQYFRSTTPALPCGGAGQPACVPAVDADKRIINFSGIVMDNGVSAARKQLSLVNARFTCNRRDTGGNQGFTPNNPGGIVGPTIASRKEASVDVLPGANGAAVSVLGNAAIALTTMTFSNNIADFGSGGAVFAGARDNASPSLTVSGTSTFDNSILSCRDSVLVTDSSAAGTSNQTTSCPGPGVPGQSPICPAAGTAAYFAYAPGNMAGTADATGGPAALPAAAIPGRDGGAIAVSALNAVVGNIGPVDIRDTQFLFNKAANRGGALSLVNVARADTSLPAFQFDNVLFGGAAGTGNIAVADGGGVFILGNTNTPARSSFTFTSFGNNIAAGAAGKGGALHYVTRPGAPVDFTLENVRFGDNTAGCGGAIFAEDNGVDDSGLLNISKTTFEGNTATSPACPRLPPPSALTIPASGGAIFCGATKGGSQITNVTISGNTAANGGGIYVGSRCHLDLNNDTITANTATTTGGGLFVDPGVPQNGRMDVRNSIVAANIAVTTPANPPGCDLVAGTPNPDCLNFSAGAPLFGDCDGNGATMDTADDCPIPPGPFGDCETVADNDGFPTCPPIGADCAAVDNLMLRSAGLGTNTPGRGFNFIGSTLGCGGVGTTARPFLAGRSGAGTCVTGISPNLNTQTGDIVGSFANANVHCTGSTPLLNATLRVLSDNGGPDILGARNFTHEPDTLSPVINTADNLGCKNGLGSNVTEDEREIPRDPLQTGRCDIGAVETGSPVVPNVQIVTLGSVIDTSPIIDLAPAQGTEVEMLRVRVTAPQGIGVTLRSLRLQGEAPSSGTAGDYISSVVGVRIYQVNDQGVRLAQVFTSGATRPFDLRLGSFADTAITPIALGPGQSVDFSVTYVYGTSAQLAMLAPKLLLAGGLALLPLLGLLGVGRRRLVLVALVMTLAVTMTACGDDDDDDGDQQVFVNPPPPPGSQPVVERTFRAGIRRVDFDVGSPAQLRQQAVVAVGGTARVIP